MKAETVGQALRHLRKLRGLTQAEVGSRAGCTKAQISSYELARRTLYVATLARIVHAMGFRLTDFGRAVEYFEKHPPPAE